MDVPVEKTEESMSSNTAEDNDNKIEKESDAALDPDIPDPSAPRYWQCTDIAALTHLTRQNTTASRTCLAFDNTNGYTYYNGHCIPSDYNGCIDTYNKFKSLEHCTKSKVRFIRFE